MKENGCEPLAFVEERVNYSHIAPSGFGTADMLIIGKDENGRGLLHVCDFKTGKGVFVDADHNSQMMLYALGGLAAYGFIYDIDRVRMSIIQPRLDNISTFECSRQELEEWGESIKPIAKLAYEGKGEQKPGDWCRFCRVKPVCRACADEALALCREDFLDLDAGALSDETEESDMTAPYEADTQTAVFKQPGLISYQAMATGYQKVDGSCGYAFQYPVMKTVNLHQIPGTDRTYLCKLALEQSFMEMMYRIKREYDEQGEDCFFCREIRLALANTVNVDGEKQKIAAIQNEINATAETYKRANAGKTKAELSGRKTTAYEELIRDISEKMKQLEAQKAELEEIVSGSSIRENYKAFLEKLKALPTTNSLGNPIIVNGSDCQGTLLVDPDGSINEQRIVGVRRKTFRITPERVAAAPELLTFDADLYRILIKSGVIYCDEIEYETTFGTTLKIAGNVRTLKQFLGSKRVNNDQTVDYLTATYQVNGSSLSKRNAKNKPYKGKK